MTNKALRTGISAVLMSTAIVALAAGASEIYRYTDENGNVHYTDTPMGEPSERLDIQSRRTDRAAVEAQLQARLDRKAKADEAAAAAEADAPSREEVLADRKERQEKCATYRERLTRLVQNRRIYREDENGERDYLDEDQMAQVRADAQAKVEEYCGS